MVLHRPIETTQSYAVFDASGGFTQTQVDMGILRMQHAGVIPVCYSNVAVEILADNAAPEAEAVYGALSMPFGGLVFDLRQYFRVRANQGEQNETYANQT